MCKNVFSFVGSGKNYYLGASPDGLVGEDDILKIKCLQKAKDMDVKTAMNKNIIKFANIVPDNEIHLKKNYKYMYQIQGQLYLFDRKFCYLMVWTNKV